MRDHDLEPWQDICRDTYDPDRVTEGKAYDYADEVRRLYGFGPEWTADQEELTHDYYIKCLQFLLDRIPERIAETRKEIARPMGVEERARLDTKIRNYHRLGEATARKLKELRENPPKDGEPAPALKARRLWLKK